MTKVARKSKQSFYNQAAITVFDLANWFCGGGKTYVIIRTGVMDDGSTKVKITHKDIVKYYATDARNLMSGCRSLADITGEWRNIDNLAKNCLQYFKLTCRPLLVREAKKYNMTLK